MSSKNRDKSKSKSKHGGLFKKKRRDRARHHAPPPVAAAATAGNPFDDFGGEDDESSEFESPAQSTTTTTSSSTAAPPPKPEPMPSSVSATAGRSASPRRTSVGQHRPAPLPISPSSRRPGADDEINDRSFQEPDEPFFRSAHVRPRSSSSSSGVEVSPRRRRWRSPSSGEEDDDDEEGEALSAEASPRRLTQRTKTKMFTTKATYLEQDERMRRLEDMVYEIRATQVKLEKHSNTLSSVQKALYFRMVTMLDMMSEISRGAEYYMKDHKSIPYQTVLPADKRPKPRGMFSWLSGDRGEDGYEEIPVQGKEAHERDYERDQAEATDQGCF